MRLVLLSDTHNRHEFIQVPDGDAVIHAGDFGKKGYPKEAEDFCSWFGTLPHKIKIFIQGNHDTQDPAVIETLADKHGLTYLNNGGIILDNGFHVWGTCYGYETDFQQVPIWTPVNLLLTHYPPQKILDEVERKSGFGLGYENIGSFAVRKHVQLLKPKYHVFGHVHEWAGKIVTTTDTMHINACLFDEYLRPAANPQVIDV